MQLRPYEVQLYGAEDSHALVSLAGKTVLIVGLDRTRAALPFHLLHPALRYDVPRGTIFGTCMGTDADGGRE